MENQIQNQIQSKLQNTPQIETSVLDADAAVNADVVVMSLLFVAFAVVIRSLDVFFTPWMIAAITGGTFLLTFGPIIFVDVRDWYRNRSN